MKKKERKILRIYKNYFFFSFNFNQCCIINNNHEEIRKVLHASNRRKTIFFSRMKEKIYIYITICFSFPFLFFIVTLKKDETFSYTYTYKYTHPFIFECNFTQADILNFRVSLICCNNEIIERIKHFDYFI